MPPEYSALLPLFYPFMLNYICTSIMLHLYSVIAHGLMGLSQKNRIYAHKFFNLLIKHINGSLLAYKSYRWKIEICSLFSSILIVLGISLMIFFYCLG